MLGWLRGLRHTLRRDYFPPPVWERLQHELPVLQGLDSGERARLRDLANEFLGLKSIEGAAGLSVDDELRRIIALQACLPVLALGLGHYRGWYSVVVYPGEFLASHEYEDEAGVVHTGSRELTGESWPQGPVILSREDVERDAREPEWGNVVIHELAHKLDMLNGDANGMPPLHRGMSAREWTAAFTEAYEDLVDRVERDEPTAMDPYAAHSPGEFFAVASEDFFLYPGELAGAYPQVYRQLAAYYRQDPLRRRAQ